MSKWNHIKYIPINGIAITSYDAIKRLKEVGAKFTIQDDGSIVTETWQRFRIRVYADTWSAVK